MAIKLLVSDLDGTLLGENSIITEETADAIKAAQNIGIRWLAATGRPWSGAYS